MKKKHIKFGGTLAKYQVLLYNGTSCIYYHSLKTPAIMRLQHADDS